MRPGILHILELKAPAISALVEVIMLGLIYFTEPKQIETSEMPNGMNRGHLIYKKSLVLRVPQGTCFCV